MSRTTISKPVLLSLRSNRRFSLAALASAVAEITNKSLMRLAARHGAVRTPTLVSAFNGVGELRNHLPSRYSPRRRRHGRLRSPRRPRDLTAGALTSALDTRHAIAHFDRDGTSPPGAALGCHERQPGGVPICAPEHAAGALAPEHC